MKAGLVNDAWLDNKTYSHGLGIGQREINKWMSSFIWSLLVTAKPLDSSSDYGSTVDPVVTLRRIDSGISTTRGSSRSGSPLLGN